MKRLLNTDPNAVEILKNRLYWSSTQFLIQDPMFFYFSVDDKLVYSPLHYDFGPIDISKVYKFTRELLQVLHNPKFSNAPLVYYTNMDPAKRANSAFLMCAFQVIVHKTPAEEAWKPFSKITPPLLAFRDASNTKECTYPCTILDCLRGLEYAMKLKWFDFATFDAVKYDYYSRLDVGDINWIIPGKLLAFSGPLDVNRDAKGNWRKTPEDYIPIFHRLKVGTVIRLNDKVYNEEKFKAKGINHKDIIFQDGSCPNQEIIRKFLTTCEQEPKALAIHCKAGLGRTGTLIGCYAMKHYKFPAADFIGWIRLCRPGSVLGPQQQFLIDIEPSFHSLSQSSDIYKSLSKEIKSFIANRREEEQRAIRGVLSENEKRMAMYGDSSQGNDLLEAKKTKDRLTQSFKEFDRGSFLTAFDKTMPLSSYRATLYEEDIPEEVERTVNRIFLSKHECASRGTLSKSYSTLKIRY